MFQEAMKNLFKRGQSKDIFLLIDGEKYGAKLINQRFDESKYPNHKDVLQIRYNTNSEIALKLRDIFKNKYTYVQEQRRLKEHDMKQKKIIKIPAKDVEYIALYMTGIEDEFLVDYVLKSEIDQVSNIFIKQNEYEFEKTVNYNFFDLDARIEVKEKAVKVRKLDRAVGDSLKLLYNFTCQICGENFGKIYDANIVETHHIDPFVKSLNNNADNQIVICPNHHSVIHNANPIFDKNRLTFNYRNGYEDRIILNSHINGNYYY